MGIRFLANRAEIFYGMGTQDTFIYQLVMRNHDFDDFLKKSVFGGKMDVASRPDQKLAHSVDCGTFGSTIMSNKCLGGGDYIKVYIRY